MIETLISRLFTCLDTLARLERQNYEPRSAVVEWWETQLADCVDMLPHGSGFDNDYADSDIRLPRPNRLEIDTGFHHMDENGFYTCWTEHTVVVTPSFAGFDVRVTGRGAPLGRDHDGVKEYIGDLFHETLSQPAPDRPDFPRRELGEVV